MPSQPAMAVEAESLSPANLSAARQHIRTLSTSEREALLRALLEQYESPQGALAEGPSTHPAPASSIPAVPGTIFECPSLPEETENDGSHHPTALSPAPKHPKRSASSSTSTSWPIRSASASAVTTQQSPKQPHVRSHSISHSALRSSFSTNRQTADSVALFHYRSKSYSTSPELDSKAREKAKATAIAVATPAPAEPRASTESTDTIFHGGLNIITPANADILQGPATVGNSLSEARPFAYWCTSCGDQFSHRSPWAEHDVTCRATGRHNGRKRHSRPQRAWACGFCAAFLGSVERYHDHVAGHLERGKTLADWHYANVIYGLLHQPVVHKAWKRIWAARAAALPVGHRPKATWPSGCKFPTKRTDANAKSTPRTSSDTRDSSSTDNNGENVVYLGLKEALESFDPAVESAALIVLHAESLAIFISVPIEDGSSSRGGSRGRSRGDIDKDRQRPRARPRGRDEEGVQTATATAAAMTTATITVTTIKSTTPTEVAESPKPDATQPTARAATTAAPASPPSTTVAPPVAAPISAPAAASASTPTPAPLTLVAGRSKDDPLPALPLFATVTASLPPPPASNTNKSAKKESKTRRTSVRATALKPLNLFRSKEPETASKDKDKEKEKEKEKSKDKDKDATAIRKAFKARALALGSLTTVTAGSPPNTTTYRPTYWADRPLPPLIMDDNPAASLAASSSSPSPSSSPDTQARLMSADHYTLTSPASSQPPKAEALDMDTMAAAYVDDFMTAINAKRAVRG
ncbi:hypothetical protein F503_02263 [Ophiostoma piceae UAMH 11346]|uniref:C2H2-type domain-containing protein n=1 Tax=Ophiostoma piceae (strain UAMH 11346) TaxID=1262450 RepID=S3BW88_OPHP1|nr:hypothetical protein F503_02263 [Ophiostoma piceae UAMH 11346]